jgi:pyochelin synthetase
MVPAKVHFVDFLPVSANGKIDSKQLQTWIAAQEIPVSADNPVSSSDLERRISAVWAELFQVAQIPLDQGLLQLGGDSLMAAKIAGRMRESIQEAKHLYFDDLLRKILQDRSIREIAQALATPDDASAPGEVTAFALKKLAGSGPPTRALIQDAAGRLDYCAPLVAPLSETGTVLGLVVGDVGSYLETDPEKLVACAAQSYVEALIDGGFLRVDVIGCAEGAEIAVEVARQLLEAGAIVDKLVIIDGPDSENAAQSATSTDHVREHSRRAFRSFAPSAYIGDMTIAGLRGHTARIEQLAESWRALTLGDIDLVFGGFEVIKAELLNREQAR